MSSAAGTTNHKEIRKWIEERGGRPSRVKRSRPSEDGGILRVDFGEPEASLEEISWEEFFETFEHSKLKFLHQDKTEDGKISRFCKFVRRED